MQTYIDLAGLTLTDQTTAMLLTAELPGTRVSIDHRLFLLARLRTSVGVRVVTGPWGREFWSLCSPAVKVQVWPDGYEYTERTDEWTWAVVQQGEDAAYAKALLDKPPTRGRRLAVYLEAEKLKGQLWVCLPTPILAGPQVEVLPDEAALVEVLDRIGACSIDYEWQRGTDRDITAVSVSDHARDYYLPLRACADGGSAVLRAIEHRVQSGVLFPVYHDARADLSRHEDPLSLFGCTIDDTLVKAFVAGETGELGLKQLSKRLLDRDPMPYPDGFEDLPVDVQAYYAASGDGRNTYDLDNLLTGRLAEQGMLEFYQQIERPLVPLVAHMEKVGSRLDLAVVRKLRDRWQRAEERVRGLYLKQGYDIAVDAEVRRLVTDRTGHDPGSVAKPVLSKIPGRWIDGVLRYRQLRTTRRNYLDKLLDAGEEWIHPRFNQAGSTEDGENFKSAPRTGRFSSSKPNLQQTPKAIREVFVPPDGCVFWARDWNSMELWLAALLSGDEAMRAALEAGDLHADFRERIRTLTGVLVPRTAAKNGNFLMQYEGEADKLVTTMAMQRAMLDYPTAVLIVDSHRKAYPRLHQHNKEMVELARKKGYAETYFGRRRYLPELRSDDPKVRSHAERAAINHPVQGTGADMLKIVMRGLVPVLREFDAHMSIILHDEVGGWCPADRIAEFVPALTEVTDSIIINGHQMTTSGGVGRNWREAK